jgi:hypothetical protein
MAHKKLSNCKYCQITFEGLNASQRANHSRWCDLNPKRKTYKNGSANAVAAMLRAKQDSGNTN